MKVRISMIILLGVCISSQILAAEFEKQTEYTVLKLEMQGLEKIRDDFYVAWIDISPSMPSIKAKILPDGLNGEVKWSCKIHFYEKIRRKVKGVWKEPIISDKIVFTKSETLAASSIWEITKDIGSDFWGGEALMGDPQS